MARKPQRRSEQEPASPERPEPAKQIERLGPVTIERLSKDDGRALIVYRVEPATP